MTTPRIHLDGRKWASLALIPFALILIVLFTVLDIRVATEPPFLLTILNTVFIGIIPLVIAAIALRSYRSSGSASLFMMGSGMMIFGLGSIAAGWLIGLPGGANISVAIYNVSIFLSAVFYLAGALLTFIRRSTPKTTGSLWKIAAVTGGIIIFEAAFIVLTIAGSIPPFFIAGSGPTVLRQVILSNAIVILAIASILLFHVYRQKREDFFFWYSVSLAVIATGLVAAFFIPALGSPVNWVSRVMQYIGAGFALVAIIVAGKQARDRGLSLEETLGRFFSDAEAGYQALVETATDAIVVFDAADRVIVWNRAAEKMFGYDAAEAIGSSFTKIAVPEESVDIVQNNFKTREIPGTRLVVPRPVELNARRRDGSTFPAELTLTRQIISRTEVSTCIIRDLTERKNAEKEVLRMSTFPAQNPNPIVEIDTEGCMQYLNPSAMRLFPGMTGDTQNRPFIGDIRLFLDTVSRNPDSPITREILAGDRWYQQSINYLRDIDRVRIYGMDITDQKQAEASLRVTEERYRNLFSAMPSGVAVYDVMNNGIDPDGKDFIFKDMNPAGEKIDHVQRSEIVGKSLYDFFPSARTIGLPDVFKRVYQTGVPEYFPVALYADNKISLWVTNYVWRLPSGELVALFEDVTERKRADDALKENQHLLADSQRLAKVGSWKMDLSTGEISFSDEMIRILELGPGKHTYADFQNRVHPEDRPAREAAVKDSIDNGKPYITEYRILLPNGEIRHIRAVGTALRDPSGKPEFFTSSIQDITDRKNAEQELSRKNEDLALREENLSKALAEKEILLAEIHHRVKNNLMAFISLLSLEGSTEETEAGRELKKDLQNRARSMALIHETLYKTHQFSSVDMETYLTPLIDQIVNSYSSPQSIRTIVEANGVSLDLARATPIGLIVNELVTNSLKHAFPHGGKECRAGQNDPCTIGIRLTKEDGSYLMSVYDNGVGLPAGFDPLTAKTLGLKLVTFLAKHQVRAKIEVKREKGTEFVFRFKE